MLTICTFRIQFENRPLYKVSVYDVFFFFFSESFCVEVAGLFWYAVDVIGLRSTDWRNKIGYLSCVMWLKFRQPTGKVAFWEAKEHQCFPRTSSREALQMAQLLYGGGAMNHFCGSGVPPTVHMRISGRLEQACGLICATIVAVGSSPNRAKTAWLVLWSLVCDLWNGHFVWYANYCCRLSVERARKRYTLKGREAAFLSVIK